MRHYYYYVSSPDGSVVGTRAAALKRERTYDRIDAAAQEGGAP
jgi:hypothetical protein